MIRYAMYKQDVEKRSEDTRLLGARRAGTGMYVGVHEDSEHRATTQTGTAVVLQQPAGPSGRFNRKANLPEQPRRIDA